MNAKDFCLNTSGKLDFNLRVMQKVDERERERERGVEKKSRSLRQKCDEKERRK